MPRSLIHLSILGRCIVEGEELPCDVGEPIVNIWWEGELLFCLTVSGDEWIIKKDGSKHLVPKDTLKVEN
jgi:hypothetical protein